MILGYELAIEDVQRGIDYHERWANDPRLTADKQAEHCEKLVPLRERMEGLRRGLEFEKKLQSR